MPRSNCRSGDIEIEEFMERMRAEKKWRMRAAMAKTAKAERHDEVTMQALTAQTKCERDAIIEGHAKSEWDRAVMKATLMAWGQGSMTGQGMDDDERQWRQREEQAVMAEMAAEKEEQEAREAEVAYDKEELEAIHAEAEFQRECAEARVTLRHQSRWKSCTVHFSMATLTSELRRRQSRMRSGRRRRRLRRSRWQRRRRRRRWRPRRWQQRSSRRRSSPRRSWTGSR